MRKYISFIMIILMSVSSYAQKQRVFTTEDRDKAREQAEKRNKAQERQDDLVKFDKIMEAKTGIASNSNNTNKDLGNMVYDQVDNVRAGIQSPFDIETILINPDFNDYESKVVIMERNPQRIVDEILTLEQNQQYYKYALDYISMTSKGLPTVEIEKKINSMKNIDSNVINRVNDYISNTNVIADEGASQEEIKNSLNENIIKMNEDIANISKALEIVKAHCKSCN